MGYVPLVVPVPERLVVSALLGTALPAGHAQNPFATSSALVLDRWVAVWGTLGAPDILQYVHPHMTGADVLQVIRIWIVLLGMPVFRTELERLKSNTMFLKMVTALHVRILLLVLIHRIIRINILCCDQHNAGRVTMPYLVDAGYEMAYEIQLHKKLHPWLHPGFILNPSWLGRRSRWSLTALHTSMCILRRITHPHRSWVRPCVVLAQIAELAWYTRVPVGHVCSALPGMAQRGLSVDPVVTALLPDAAVQLIALLRNDTTWNVYAKNTPVSLEHVTQPGNLRAVVQWRPWVMVDAEHVLHETEPLYTSTPVVCKKSSVVTHVREVHFEMYRRWIALNTKCAAVPPTKPHLYNIIMEPLENYLETMFAGLFDWVTLQIIPARWADFSQRADVILATQPRPDNKNVEFLRQAKDLFSHEFLAVELNE